MKKKNILNLSRGFHHLVKGQVDKTVLKSRDVKIIKDMLFYIAILDYNKKGSKYLGCFTCILTSTT
jgi:hypothetical protein